MIEAIVEAMIRAVSGVVTDPTSPESVPIASILL
jgi:hypothetical protein